MIAVAVIVLPLPDSPIRPVVRPAATVNETSSTTRTGPAGPGRSIDRCSTRSSGAGSAPLPTGAGSVMFDDRLMSHHCRS